MSYYKYYKYMKLLKESPPLEWRPLCARGAEARSWPGDSDTGPRDLSVPPLAGDAGPDTPPGPMQVTVTGGDCLARQAPRARPAARTRACIL